jgi:hypothetical protein
MQNSAITDVTKTVNGKQKSNLKCISKPTIVIENEVSSGLSIVKPIDHENNFSKFPATKKISKRGSLFTFISSIFNWLNGSSNNQIDTDMMEQKCDQQLGIRKWNL